MPDLVCLWIGRMVVGGGAFVAFAWTMNLLLKLGLRGVDCWLIRTNSAAMFWEWERQRDKDEANHAE